MATVQVPVAIDTPGGDAAYPDLTTNNGFTNVRRSVMVFPDAAAGTATGICRVPQDYASAGTIICRFAANATANAYNVRVSTTSQANAESADAAYTDEAYQSITTAATAKVNKDVTFTLTPTLAAGDTLTVKVTRDGAGASGTDSLTANLLLLETVLQYTST
jgi:hypothetical protein